MTETTATYGPVADAASIGLPVEILAALESELRKAYARGYFDGQADAARSDQAADHAIDAWAEIDAAVTASTPQAVTVSLTSTTPCTDDWDFEPGADVVTSRGTTFHRVTSGVVGDYPTQIRIEADRTLTDDEVDHLGHLVSYAYQATVRGDAVSHPERDSEYSFVVTAQTSTSRRTRPMEALAQFEANLPYYLAHGTPVRRTDRAGAGTRGTRAVDGMGDPSLAVAIYYDRVTDDD